MISSLQCNFLSVRLVFSITPETRPLALTLPQSMRPCQRETSMMCLAILRLLVQRSLYAGPPAGRDILNGKSAVKLMQLDLSYIKLDHPLYLLCSQQVQHGRFQCSNTLGGGGELGLLFSFFAGFSLCGQFLSSVQVVHPHLLFFVPGVFCFHAGHVHHLLHVFAAVWVLGKGLVVADLLHARHSIVVDGLCLVFQPAQRQVGVFHRVAVDVNDFHDYMLLSLGDALPDVSGQVGRHVVVGSRTTGVPRCKPILYVITPIRSSIKLLEIHASAASVLPAKTVQIIDIDTLMSMSWHLSNSQCVSCLAARFPRCVSIASGQNKLILNTFPCASQKARRAGRAGTLIDATYRVKLVHQCRPLDFLGVRTL
nr:MAG TPA: hypothetical protein [Bacteriophage sp.]